MDKEAGVSDESSCGTFITYVLFYKSKSLIYLIILT